MSNEINKLQYIVELFINKLFFISAVFCRVLYPLWSNFPVLAAFTSRIAWFTMNNIRAEPSQDGEAGRPLKYHVQNVTAFNSLTSYQADS